MSDLNLGKTSVRTRINTVVKFNVQFWWSTSFKVQKTKHENDTGLQYTVTYSLKQAKFRAKI